MTHEQKIKEAIKASLLDAIGEHDETSAANIVYAAIAPLIADPDALRWRRAEDELPDEHADVLVLRHGEFGVSRRFVKDGDRWSSKSFDIDLKRVAGSLWLPIPPVGVKA